MKEKSGVKPTGKLFEAITKTFSSFDEFKTLFSEAGLTSSGSGWTWLCISEKDRLFIYSSGNDNSPAIDLAETVGAPLITLDTPDQSYLKNQNRPSDYIDAFWSVLDWNEISRRYENANKLLTLNKTSEDVMVNVMETTTN